MVCDASRSLKSQGNDPFHRSVRQGLYGSCGSRNSRRFGSRATDLKNGNAGPKLHWGLWEKIGFSALPCDRGYVPKIDTPI